MISLTMSLNLEHYMRENIRCERSNNMVGLPNVNNNKANCILFEKNS